MTRIMIVDDDVAIQMELEEFLTQMNYDVVGIVDKGDMAVEMAGDMKPDLILMDVVMPGRIDGISAAEEIKEEMDTAVVFITGYGDPEYIERAKQVEPFGYVMKPFDEKEIKGVIEIALHKRNLELELKKANRELEREIEERKRTEKALSDSEAQKNAILNGITTNLAFVNEDLEILWANKAAADSACRTPDAMEGHRCYELWADPAKPCEGCPTLKAFKTKKTRQTIMHTPDGKVWDEKGEPVFDGKGELIGVLAIAHDITDRAQAEDALKASRQKLSQIIDFLPDATFVIDTEGMVIAWNRAIEDMTGVKAEDMLGKGNHEYAIPFYGERRPVLIDIVGQWNKDIEKKYEYIKKDGESLVSETYDSLVKRGGFLWNKASLLYNKSGEVTGAIESIRDITERKVAEAALLESEKKYKEIVEGTDDLITIVNKEGKFLYVNERSNSILGLTPKDCIGKPAFDFIHPDDQEYTLEWFNENLATHQISGTIENRQINRNGTIRHVLWTSNFHYDNEGELINIGSIARDVTERKWIEERREETLSQLQATLEATVDGIIVVGLDAKIKIFSNRFAKIWGMPESILESKEADQALQHMLDQLNNPRGFSKKVQAAFTDPDVDTFDTLHLKNGRIFEAYSRPQKMHDKMIGRVWGFRDVTKNKQAEEKLQESEKKFRTLFDESPYAAAVTEIENGRFIDVNRTFCELMGYRKEEIVGKATADEYYSKENREKFIDELKSKGAVNGLEMAFTAKSGAKLIAKMYARAIDISGTPRLLTMFLDITEQKRLENLLLQSQKMEAIGTLTGGIAHDYNNLMSIIMGNLSLAREEAEPGSNLADFLKNANTASRKVRDLTHELMSLSRGGGPVREVGSLDEVLKNISELIPADSGISLTESISQDLELVPYDQYKMAAVIRNVVKNAVEAMPNGGTLKIKAENLRVEEDGKQGSCLILKPGNFVHISIQDRGNGIPEEDMDKIFDPYFSSKARGVQKGMGLGLATAYAIVKQHGGHLQIDSTPGAGTTVNIYLPAETGSEQMDSAITSADTKTSSAKRMLVMDDEEMIRTLTRQILERIGYAVETVKDGLEAIEAYKKQKDSGEPFDAVILDLTIKGGMGGEETIRELLKIDPGIKAIVSSGYFNDPVMADFQKYGFKGAIAKPYGLKKVKEIVETLFS